MVEIKVEVRNAGAAVIVLVEIIWDAAFVVVVVVVVCAPYLPNVSTNSAFLMAAEEMGVPARLQASWSGVMKRFESSW